MGAIIMFWIFIMQLQLPPHKQQVPLLTKVDRHLPEKNPILFMPLITNPLIAKAFYELYGKEAEIFVFSMGEEQKKWFEVWQENFQAIENDEKENDQKRNGEKVKDGEKENISPSKQKKEEALYPYPNHPKLGQMEDTVNGNLLEVRASSSVAIIALELLRKLNYQRVITFGLDGAYSYFHGHAQGSMQSNYSLERCNKLSPVEGSDFSIFAGTFGKLDKEHCHSIPTLDDFKNEMVEIVRRFDDEDVPLRVDMVSSYLSFKGFSGELPEGIRIVDNPEDIIKAKNLLNGEGAYHTYMPNVKVNPQKTKKNNFSTDSPYEPSKEGEVSRQKVGTKSPIESSKKNPEKNGYFRNGLEVVKIFFRSDEDVFSNIIQKKREKLISILDVCRECIRLVNNEEAIDKFYSDLYIEYPFFARGAFAPVENL